MLGVARYSLLVQDCRMGMIRRVGRGLGLRRDLVLMLAALTLVGFGEELWLRFIPKYLVALGAGVWMVGAYDALKTLLAAIYAYPGGALTDRLGHRRSLSLFTLASIAGYLLVAAVPHWLGVMLGMFLFLAWGSLSLPATFSLVAERLARNQYAMGIGVQSIVKRVPILIGPVVGGLLIDQFGVVTGVRIGTVLGASTGIVALLTQWRLQDTSRIGYQDLSLRRVFTSFNPELRNLLWSDILIRFCERIPYAFVVLYAMDVVGVSALQFGLLTSVEMAAAMICFIPTAYLSDRYGRYWFIIITFVFFTLFPLALLASDTFPLLIAAFAIRGLKEFGETARKALILEQTQDGTRSRTVGAYYLIRDVSVTAGALVGAWLWSLSPRANLLGASLIGLAGTIYFVLTARR